MHISNRYKTKKPAKVYPHKIDFMRDAANRTHGFSYSFLYKA